MLPFIRGGKDTMDLGALTEDSLQVGRIVLAHIPQGYLVHRIERIDGDRFTLRGDGNREQREYCTREQILAEVVEVQRGKRSIRPGDRLWWCYEHLWTKSPFWRRWILAGLSAYTPSLGPLRGGLLSPGAFPITFNFLPF